VLDAIAVSKTFPGVRALDSVSLSVRPGEVHALVGENGAGKSTLIKVLTGVYRPDAGELRLAGERVRFATPLSAQRAGISTIYQEVNLIPLMSVARNLFLGREPRRRGLIDTGTMHRVATETLRGYGITGDVRRPLGQLALGAQQMVALARAVMVDARIVVMDEPTSSLEPREVETLFGVIDGLRGKGTGIVYVSHRLDELYRICDRVTVLRDGRNVHSGPMADLARLNLVALMLGRDMATVDREGVTGFSAESRLADSVPVLTATGLRSRHRLHGVDVAVRPGEVVGLGGLLGAGRTETVRAIAGALPLDAGTVEVDGKPVPNRTGAAVRAGIAALPEDRKAEGIVPGLSVRENIALAVLPRMSRAGIVSEKRIDEIVERFMARLRIKAAGPHQPVGELSGGNQQKVLLARLLATAPKVLLLDEPTRGIDVGAKAEMFDLIGRLAQDGRAIVLISSHLPELLNMCDRILVMREGRIAGEVARNKFSEERVMALATGAEEAT